MQQSNLFISLVVLFVFAPQQATLAQSPNLIVHNARIATVDKQFRIAEAMAISGSKIVGVGSNEQILSIKGDNTEVIDLEGKFVMPGLIDSHTHPTGASMFEFDHPVPEMVSVQDVLDYIRTRTNAVPEGEWIWVNQVFITRLREQRYPTKAELDAIAPKHPVVFSTGPDASVNSLALGLSGIDKNFQVTGAGAVERDASTGEPTGLLRGDTKRFLKSKSPREKATDDERYSRLVQLFHDYNATGITCIADRNANPAAIHLFERLRRENKQTVRIAVSHSVDASEKLDAIQKNIAAIAQHPLRQPDPMLRIIGIKTFQDGGMLTGSAYMRQPWGLSDIYAIRDAQYRGVLFIPKDKLMEVVRQTVSHGLQFTAHSVGDGAVYNLVDVYEELSRTMPVRETRPCITHCNFMGSEVIERMSKLGIVADIQPAWLYLDSRTLENQFGYERLRYFQPLKTFLEAGGIAGGGSDHMQKIGSLRSINPYNPFLGMWVTISRRAKDYEGQMHPEEALDRQQAIRFYTTNNAFLVFLEEQIGSLESKKFADFIVLDRNLLECPEEDIRHTKVLQTYVNGKLVFSK